MTAHYIKWFDQLRKDDIDVAGGKGANLGELVAAGIPVPDGFVVLSSAYYKFLEFNKLRVKIHQILSVCDSADPTQLRKASLKIQKLILNSKIPDEIATEVFVNYHKLGQNAAVAVRSSATAEDLPDASFAGQQESYLDISGDSNVLLKLRECWASLFGERSIFYREQKKYDHFKIGIAVPVQKMIQSEVSGVMFTVNPISQNKDSLVIEAVWGLGDYMVQGVVTPDHYEVSRVSQKITVKRVSTQLVMEVRARRGVKEVKVPVKFSKKQKISDDTVIELFALGNKIQQHYMAPQDIEWAIKNKHIYITQSRPITTLNSKKGTPFTAERSVLKGSSIILTGSPASPGLVSGPVKIVDDIKHLDVVKSGDILVTDMTTPDFVPAMKRAAAIITNRGGATSHAAIVSRELGVPCVVGTTTATKVLTSGMLVTVNGTTGEIFKGLLGLNSVNLEANKPEIHLEHIKAKTATKIYVNLGEPEMASEMAKRHVDGVGLLRAEFMIAEIGTHPKKLIAEKKSEVFIDKLAQGLVKFCEAFSPRPIIYRATDFKTNEYRALKGGELYEPQESNPMLGFRGAYRYVKNPDVFNLELEAIKRVRNKYNFKNLWLLIPFVSTPKEMEDVKKLVVEAGLYRTASLKLLMMVEIPSNVILLEEFIKVGIDGVSIGSNDLTMLLLGIDRDNSEVAPNFDERNPAVLWALEKTIKTCLKHDIMCGICGQAPSRYPELVQKLVNWGITSVSVNPDAIELTRDIVYDCEKGIARHGQD